MGIFKAYDIRGIYPQDLSTTIAYRIGRATVQYLKCPLVVMAHDMRESSPALKQALIDGITDEGADVIDAGLTTTPMLYYIVYRHQHPAGLMITASHNPKEYNGIKIVREDCISLSGEHGLSQIKELTEKDMPAPTDKKGTVRKMDFLDEYLSFLRGRLTDGEKRLVIDYGNGMGGHTVPLLLKGTGYQVTHLYADLDGTFPNHEANPSKHETLKVLCATVKEKRADLGIAFDGDADRIALIDEKGDIVSGDILTAFLADHLLEGHKGEEILYEVRSSRAVPETIKRRGGVPVLWKAGHSLIKEKMRAESILFGGEMSGHYFYRELHYTDSAEYTMLNVLRILKDEKAPLSALLRPYKTHVQSGEINISVPDADAVIAGVKKAYAEGKLREIDGITVDFPDWWFNLRKSNTEPVIRLNLEAKTREMMEEKKDAVIGTIKSLI